MKIKDYKDAQAYYIKDDRGDATGAFADFVREPRNMYAGGQLVQPSDDGSRPGYSGVEPIKYQAATKSYRLNIVPSKFGPGIEVRNKDKAVLESLYKKYLDNNPEYKKHITYLENYESDIKKLSKTNTQTEALDAIEKKYGFRPDRKTVSGKFEFKPRKYSAEHMRGISTGKFGSKWVPKKYSIEVLESELKSGKSTRQMAKEIFQSNPEKYLKLSAGKKLVGSTPEGYAIKEIYGNLDNRIGTKPKLNKINQNIIEAQAAKKLKARGGKSAANYVAAKRYANLKMTDPTKAAGTKKFQYHHVRQIAGGVPLTSDDILIIDQKINSKLGGATNKALNRISEAIQKNNRLALEAMNAKNEGLALEYMKRSDNLNAQAEKIVNSAIDDLPKKYKGYVGFNQFTLPRDEYGLPIRNEPMIIKKVGGMPVSKDAIDLTTLSRKDEAKFRKIVKQQAEAGETGPINIKTLTKQFKIPKGERGFIEKELLKGVVRGTGKGIRVATKYFGIPDAIFSTVDYLNERSKGKSKKESKAQAIKNLTFGAVKNKEYMKELKKTAESMGIDARAFENVYNLNVAGQTFDKYLIKGQEQIKNLKKLGYKEEADDAQKNLDRYIEEQNENLGNLSQKVIDQVSISKAGGAASPLQLSKARDILTEEDFYKPFKDITKAATEKLTREKRKAFPTQSKQFDISPGSMGEGFYTAVDALTQGAKNVLQGRIIPYGPKRFRPLESERQKQKRYLQEMEPRELYLYNKDRGYTYDQPLTDADLEDLRYNQPGVFYASGGLASLTDTIPPESGPMSQGLRSLYNNVRKL